MAPDPNAEAGWRRALARRGVRVLVQRLSGVAPRTTTISAEVTAYVHNVTPDTQEPERAGLTSSTPGTVRQSDRAAVVMAADLARQRFPLPVQVNDKLVVVASTEKFSVTRVDPYRLALAGAIELTMAGVA